jgi:hypothetical protein
MREAKTIPIKIVWSPRWDKNDALFYVGKSFEAKVKRLDGTPVNLYSTRIQIGPIKIMLGFYPHEGFEDIVAQRPRRNLAARLKRKIKDGV